jgi:predicted deacylase
MTPKPSRITAEVDFDRPGRQTGFLRLFHSVHESAYGFIPIPIVVLKHGTGPTALLVSGNHGDEYEGQVALGNLVRTLDPARISGRVIVLPMANFPAAMAGRRTSPIDGGNLNRSFPGDADGTVTQQIAHYIEHVLLPRCDLVLDLHSGGSSLIYLPSAQVRRHANPERFAKGVAAVRAFGAPTAYMPVQAQGGGATLGGSAERQGPIAIGTELGGAGQVTPAALRIAERGVRNVLVHLGILPGQDRIEPEAPTRLLEVGGADYFVYAPEGGVFEPLVELGDMVRAGQPAGRIHSPETPWAPPATAAFARDGLVLCKRVPGRTQRGDCLFHLATDAAV